MINKHLKEHVAKGISLNKDTEKVHAYCMEHYVIPMCTKLLVNFDEKVDYTSESMVEFHDSVYINLIDSLQKYLSTMLDYPPQVDMNQD